MNLRTLKKHCRRAMETLIAEHGYRRDDFVSSDGEEAVYTPPGMERRFDRNGFLDPGPLKGTMLLWQKTSFEYDEWDASLPCEVLRDVIFRSKFEPSPEDIALWDAEAAEQNRAHRTGRAMSNITLKMKDGTVREFKHEGRPGGSYTKTLKLENGFAVIRDEYDNRTVIPAADIAEIVERPHRASW